MVALVMTSRYDKHEEIFNVPCILVFGEQALF